MDKKVQGAPIEWSTTVGQIQGSNDMAFYEAQNALGIAAQLLCKQISGAPVINQKREVVGFVSEFDVLKILELHRDLSQLTAAQMMRPNCITIGSTTPLREAIRLMEEKGLLNLPVLQDGKLLYTVTRHDLLRAWLGLDIKWGFDL